MTLTKLLVPIALSPSCSWATHYASQIARRFGSKLHFLHVGSCGREAVEAFLGPEAKEIPHEITTLQGDPAESILHVAHETSPSLIVMPTHAHGRFRRFLLGSVTAKVLHDADCPVLTGVHHADVEPPSSTDFRQIVCAVDADEGFVPVVRGAADITALFSASLTVVHAVPAADETSDNRGEIDVRKYLFRLAEEKFARLKRENAIDMKVTLVGGTVPTVVREAALRTGADLVIIGRGHVQRALGRLRTHTYGIIRSSPCPVLSI
jgi:nucleotide-binding universal stress UspA family protein